MILATMLTVLPVADQVVSFGRNVVGLAQDVVKLGQSLGMISGTTVGPEAERRLKSAAADGHRVTRLSTGSFIDHDVIEAVNLSRQQSLTDPDLLRASIAPVAAATGSLVYSSRASLAPSGLLDDLRINPNRVVIDPRPWGQQTSPPSPQHLPLLFMRDGRPHVGWQLRGILRSLQCDFQPKYGLPAIRSSSGYDAIDLATDVDAMLDSSGLRKAGVGIFKQVAARTVIVISNRPIETKAMWLGLALKGDGAAVQTHSFLFDVDKVTVVSEFTDPYHGIGVQEMSLRGFATAGLHNKGLLNRHMELASPVTGEIVRVNYLWTRDLYLRTLSFVQMGVLKLLS